MKKLVVLVAVFVVLMVVSVGVTRGDAWVGALLLGWMILRAAPGMWADFRGGLSVLRTFKFSGRGVGRRDLTV